MSEDRASGEQPRFGRGGLSLLGGTLGPLLALGVVIVVFVVADWFVNGEFIFLSLGNARTIAVQTSTVAVAALGMTVIIIAGGIDLSAGTALALSATVLAWCLRAGYPAPLAVLAGIGAGGLTGLVNGMLVSLLRVVPFIVTLGTMTIYLGLAKYIADETTVRPALEQIPGWLPALVSIRPTPEWLIPPILPNLAAGVWFALLLAGVLACVLRYSVFGRYVFALGSNESTARLCGINVPLMKIAVYTLSGLFVGIAGMYQFARLSSGSPTSGIGLELKIIAAVVIGGASLSGGRGTVLGTLAGAAMMAVIASGCTLLGFGNPAQDIIIGIIIVAAVTLDQLRERRLAK
jgi:ribose transport system permease protein